MLVIEDDPGLREIVGLVLRAAGAEVTSASDGQQGLARFAADAFDLVVLDVMLPLVDGYEVCRQIRRTSGVPIIMLTAKAQTSDLVAGLESGADDYITKPFEGPELIARMRAVLRRATPPDDDRPMAVRDLVIDPAAHTVRRGDQPVSLTAIEFRLLVELVRHAGHVLTRDALLDRVWSYTYLGDSRLVDMAVKRLRDKIEDAPGNPDRITTVRGVGYRFEAT